MKNLSINQSAARQDMDSSTATQSTYVLFVHSLDHKGNQQPGRNIKKGRNNKWGGNRKENQNDDKNNNNVGGNKKPKWKVKFPCKLCMGDHLTYFFPCI